MPASSQTSPTSSTRVTGSPQACAADRHAVDPRAAKLRQLVERARPRARRARPSTRSRSGARTRTGRTAAAARSSGGARCSSRPCCAASRPCACPCTRAPTRPSRSPSRSFGRISSTRDEPVVGEPVDDRRVAAPAVRVVVDDACPPRRGSRAPPRSPTIWSVGLDGREAVQPAVVVVEAARPRRSASARAARATRPSSKSSGPQPVAMWTIPCPSSSETSSHGHDPVLDRRAGRQVVERAPRSEARPAPRP